MPLTVGSEEDCNSYSKTCTFGGVGKGCATKGYCKSYTTKEVCNNAKTNDAIGQCVWDDNIRGIAAIIGCRVKECKDAPIIMTSDEECE